MTVTRPVSLHLSELALIETWPLFECWLLIGIMGHILLKMMQFKGLHILNVLLKNIPLVVNLSLSISTLNFEEIVNHSED